MGERPTIAELRALAESLRTLGETAAGLACRKDGTRRMVANADRIIAAYWRGEAGAYRGAADALERLIAVPATAEMLASTLDTLKGNER